MFEEGEIYDTNDLKDEEFDLSASYNEGSLYLKLIGRVDTLTAPHILTLYERVKGEHEISEVVVDCERLDYISSAGLRVLLIMKKGSPESLKLQNVNRTVEDVLEQTGFIAVFEIV
ncbi:MAG: STAS domain-containing protein [Lachnospiraceae bacterium]|nr:STAS domain-containing protein [Lachnospiraceae bacterium]